MPLRIEILNLDVHDAKGAASIMFSGITSPAYTVLRGNKVHDNVGGGIALFCVPGGYYLVEQNTVYDNRGSGNWDGIQAGGGDPSCGTHHIVIRRNVVYGTVDGDNIDMGGRQPGSLPIASHYLMEDNEMFGPPTTGNKFSGLGLDWGIMRRNKVTDNGLVFYSPPYRAVVYHNTVVSSFHSVQFWGQAGRALGPQPTFRNNLYTQSNHLLIMRGGSPLPNVTYPSSLDMDGDMFLFSERGIGWGTMPYGTSQSNFDQWRSDTSQEPNGRRIAAALSEIYVDAPNRDYQLVSGSPAIDAGVHLTTTTDTGSGTVLTVQKSWFFQDGYDSLVEPDWIQVGANPPVQIVSIDYESDIITLSTSITWSAGDGISLPYNGVAPDVGACEADDPASNPLAPTGLRLVNDQQPPA